MSTEDGGRGGDQGRRRPVILDGYFDILEKTPWIPAPISSGERYNGRRSLPVDC